MNIGSKLISEDSAFIIAELSCNHNQDFDVAVKTIHAMKKAGADCVKLQTARPESITINSDKDYFKIKGGTLWDGKTLFELYNETHTPWEWHEPIKKLTEKLGMVFFSSPFDHNAVDFLEDLNVPAYKIASFEITDIPLIRHAAKNNKPIIISTGVAMEEEINDAITACKEVGNDQIILLKCTSAYPTPLFEVNLSAIPMMREQFNVPVGLSDHTDGYIVPVGAAALGAVVIEKHFILDRALGGPDAKFSLEPSDFKLMVDNVRAIEQAKGVPVINTEAKIEKSKLFSRSLFIVENIKKGEPITLANVRSIRPGHGCAPKYLDEILGKRVNADLERGTPLKLDFIDD